MNEKGIDKEYLLEKIEERFSEHTSVSIKYNVDLSKDVIHVLNNDIVSEEQTRAFKFLDKQGNEISIHQICEVSTWKEEAVKDIGGEDAFNQEFGLRFINSSKSLLSESIIESLLKSKKSFVFKTLDPMEDKLIFSYNDLLWVDDPEILDMDMIKFMDIVLSIDISEGLGQDYSVINIFKISPKPPNLIDNPIFEFTHISDFFHLEQIGIFRSNIISVKQLSEIFYLLAFELMDPDRVKVVLEINTYGNEFLAHLPNIYDGNNNYASGIFFRYKHRSDSFDEKIGLKLGDNKNILVKEYQDNMNRRNFSIYNEDNIREITTFVKHTTHYGNVRYGGYWKRRYSHDNSELIISVSKMEL